MNAVEGEWSGTVVCAGRYDARSNAARDDWNICLVPKQRKNGAFLNGGYRYFAKKTEYREFQKSVICG